MCLKNQKEKRNSTCLSQCFCRGGGGGGGRCLTSIFIRHSIEAFTICKHFFDLYRAVLLNFVLIVVSTTANTHKKWQYLLLASAWRHLNFRWNSFMLRAVSFQFLRKQSTKQSSEMAKPKGFIWVLKKHSFQLKVKNNRYKKSSRKQLQRVSLFLVLCLK